MVDVALSESGGLVTALTGDVTRVHLPAGEFDVIDLGFDSAGAAQADAQVFLGHESELDRPLDADFTAAKGKHYLPQSSATLEPKWRAKSLSGPVLLRSAAEETTVDFRRV